MEQTRDAQNLLNMAVKHFERAVFNKAAVEQIAERIARMEGSEVIEACHMAEAIQYRGDPFDYLKVFILEELPGFIGKSAEVVERQKTSALLARVDEVFQQDIKGQVLIILDEFFRYYHAGLRVSEIKKILARLQRKYINPKTDKALNKWRKT